MSRATVDLQGVRFFLGYGLIFFFHNLFPAASNHGCKILRHDFVRLAVQADPPDDGGQPCLEVIDREAGTQKWRGGFRVQPNPVAPPRHVAADVQPVRDWKAGTINESKIKRSGTEAGFKK